MEWVRRPPTPTVRPERSEAKSKDGVAATVQECWRQELSCACGARVTRGRFKALKFRSKKRKSPRLTGALYSDVCIVTISSVRM